MLGRSPFDVYGVCLPLIADYTSKYSVSNVRTEYLYYHDVRHTLLFITHGIISLYLIISVTFNTHKCIAAIMIKPTIVGMNLEK
jgi:hypothetical protein